MTHNNLPKAALTLLLTLTLAVLSMPVHSAQDAPVKLIRINFSQDSGKTIIEFKGTKTLKYKVKEFDDPAHIMVQFLNTTNGLPYDTLTINKGPVTNLSVKEMSVNGQTSTYVSINLTEVVKFDFNNTRNNLGIQLALNNSSTATPMNTYANSPTQPSTSNSKTSSTSFAPSIPEPSNIIAYSSPGKKSSSETTIPSRLEGDDKSPYITGPVILQDADISQAIRMLSEAAGGANIVVEAKLVTSAGGITVTLSNITLEAALDVITSANNWAWRKYGDYYAIMSRDTAQEGVDVFSAGEIYSDTATKLRVYIYRFKNNYACNSDILASLKTIVPSTICDTRRNIIIIKSTDSEIARAKTLLASLDVPLDSLPKLDSQVNQIIQLDYITLTSDFQSQLGTMINNPYFGGLTISTTSPTTSSYSFTALSTISFDTTTNSIIFVGEKEIYERFFALIKKLDIPSRLTITRVIPLKYATVADIRSLEQVDSFFKSPNESALSSGAAVFSEPTNTITFIGTEEQYKRFYEIIKAFDVEERQYVTTIVKLKYLNVFDIEEKKILDGIFTTPGFGLTTKVSTYQVDKQTNSVIVTSQKQYIDNIERIVRGLDQPTFDTYEFQSFKLKYINCVRAIQIVGHILQSASIQTNAFPGYGGFFVTEDITFTGGETRQSDNHPQSYKWVISPNAADNSIYALAQPSEMAMIRRLIKELDTQRNQIRLDVQIVQLKKTNDENYQIGFMSQDGKFSLGTNFGDSNDSTFSQYIANQAGLSGRTGSFLLYDTLQDNISAFASTIDVLIQKINGRVIANPSITAQENTAANFNFSEEYTYVTTTGWETATEKWNPGITMSIIPHFKDDYIVLSANISVNEITSYTSQGYPVLAQRSLITEIQAENGIPIIIGGLTQSKETLEKASVPLLSDIPLVGSIFKKKLKNSEETEVVIVITPTVINVKP